MENDLCVINHQADPGNKAEPAMVRLLEWLSSHNRKHLKPVEQMLGEDLRGSPWPEAINQALTAATRLHAMITAHDKNYY